jgi:hypothetical protein
MNAHYWDETVYIICGAVISFLCWIYSLEYSGTLYMFMCPILVSMASLLTSCNNTIMQNIPFNETGSSLGCSDFDFFTFWCITTHPWHPKGPRIWKLAKKFFQLHPWPEEIFGNNRKMRFFGLVSKFHFRSPVWQIFTNFSACFIYEILNTKFEVSKSKTVVTREWSRQGSKFICLQNLRSKFYLTKIFFLNSFWTHNPIYYVLRMYFNP